MYGTVPVHTGRYLPYGTYRTYLRKQVPYGYLPVPSVSDPDQSVFKSPPESASVFDIGTDPDPASEIEL